MVLVSLLVGPALAASAGDADADAVPPPSVATLSRELAAKLRDAAPTEELALLVRLHDFATEEDALALRAKGITLTSALTTIPAYGATGTRDAVIATMKDPRVDRIELDLPIHFAMGVAARQTRARDVWDALPGGAPVVVDGQVIDGTGIGVAVVDSGIDATHPDLPWGTKVQKNFLRTVPIVNSIFLNPRPAVPDPVNFVDVPNSDTTSGHGTHVAGIVAGTGAGSSGFHKGAAPGATLYGYGMGQGLSVIAPLEAFDHIVRNFDSFDPPIKVVTNSWGSCGDRWDADSIEAELVGELLARDVNVIWAAGNIDSTCTNIHGGGAADDPRPGVIGVANFDGSTPAGRDGTVNPSSSQGFADQPPSMWPDVAAPGTNIRAPAATTGVLGVASAGIPRGYASFTGTSMATPHVAGVVALVRQANPSLSAADVEQVLRRTAYKYDADIDQDVGHVKKGMGLVDAFAAVHAVTQGLGADQGVQALFVTSGAITAPILRTGPQPATGAVTLHGDVLFFGQGSPSYSGPMSYTHVLATGTQAGGGATATSTTFAAGETMLIQVRPIVAQGGAPDPAGLTMRVVARDLEKSAVLFDRTCTIVTVGVERRCSITQTIPVTARSGLYEVVATLPVGATTSEVAVRNLVVLAADGAGRALTDPGARAPAAPPPAPAASVTVSARVDAGPWTPATVSGGLWSVDLTIPSQGGVVEVQATDGSSVANDRVVFVPGSPTFTLAIDGPASALVGTPVTFDASITPTGGSWTIEWDESYDGVTFDVDGTGASFTTTYATAGARTVAARADDGAGTVLLDTFAHAALAPVVETILVDTTFAQGPAVPVSLVTTFFSEDLGFVAPDPQARTFELLLPSGLSQLVVEVSWEVHGEVDPIFGFTANDIDVWIEDPSGAYAHHGGATSAHGERAVVQSPAAGQYFVDITPFLVVEPDVVHVVIKTVA